MSDPIFKRIFNLVYPVGSVYISFNNTNPSILFGGTWTQIKDRFLLASGNTYGLESTGGQSKVTLDLPNYQYRVWNTDANNSDNDISRYWQPEGTNYGLGSVYTRNKNKAFDIMPPYLTVNMWRRTA